MTSINYSSGIATTEQGLISAVDTFLTSVCGWSKIGTITDTAADRDLVFFSRGSTVGKYRDLYLRVRGTDNTVLLYMYTRWSSALSYSNEMASSVTTVSSSPFYYHLFGNQDWVWIIALDSVHLSMFGGYIDSFYTPQEDDLPVAVCGHSYSGSTDFTSSYRTNMYAPFNLSSGTINAHVSFSTQADLLIYGSRNVRDASLANYPVVMMNLASYYEVRGTMPGVLAFYGATVSGGQWYTVSGTEDCFFIQKYDNNKCFGYGPIPSGTVV